ncbi:MerR family transcriptional regulator [Allostreptomyces psammosilenae]|uniref:DNA-binding transcriptional MerR regulator n=1 Tax=Allostreptomyces psammosilenae TaxID=1892865 RepID=A0A852ZQ19_9ACTN|nr:MerR family transcriptional regulator [Allostreptomyces psammosilenae]NYI04469.1 DNA-binding transcriptional MerR regulator [Allostreptomyces psammosilenae]
MDGTWSIGELAAAAGLPVKTVRFYSDRGLLPVARRSAGGHRRYDRAALERLTMVRRLRALGLSLPAIGRVLDGEEPWDAAVAAEQRALEEELAALRWRRASLRAVVDGPPERRAARLEMVARIQDPARGAERLAAFWRSVLPVRLEAALREGVIAAAVPRPPADPDVGQLLAYAELHALTEVTPAYLAALRRREREGCRRVDPTVLYQGLGEATALATELIRAGVAPCPGDALDAYVRAHAGARGERDTAGFRRRLALITREGAANTPWVGRYWSLAEAVAGDGRVTLGAANAWLDAALRGQLRGRA